MLAMHVMMPNVISVAPDQTVAAAIRKMLDYDISGLPVVDGNGTLVGIVSEGDFLRRAELGTEKRRSRWLSLFSSAGKLAEDYVRAHGRKVEEIMTRKPVTVDEYTPLEKVAALMEKHRIKRVPVLQNEKLVGIITRQDMMRAVAGHGHAIPPLKDSDQAIRKAILDDISRQPWAVFPISVHVDVRNGVVSLIGGVADPRQAKALELLAANVRGVQSVRNELSTIELPANED